MQIEKTVDKIVNKKEERRIFNVFYLYGIISIMRYSELMLNEICWWKFS